MTESARILASERQGKSESQGQRGGGWVPPRALELRRSFGEELLFVVVVVVERDDSFSVPD